jgi:two-component system, OmpR family, response regulator ChvI
MPNQAKAEPKQQPPGPGEHRGVQGSIAEEGCGAPADGAFRGLVLALMKEQESAPAAPAAIRAGEASEPHIVAVEDDALFRELLATELSVNGFSVLVFPDAESLLEASDAAPAADALVLDWKLPGRSGFELFSELRQRGVETPVIFLTGHALVDNERRAFLAGAVDFIDKTRGFDILIRRLQLVANAQPSARVQRRLQRHGRLMLNPVEGRAVWNDVDLHLTLSEYRVIELLAAKSPGHATYREIHDQIRSPVPARPAAGQDDHRLKVRSAIRRIRRKFLACDAGFSQISNQGGLGYVWREEAGPLQADAREGNSTTTS